MCTTGLRKTTPNPENKQTFLELDELYWFVERKRRTDTRENVYLMTMVSHKPRQAIVDGAPKAEHYCTDGWTGYVDVVYPGHHIRNCRDKSDTFTVESVNADLRHYIPILARRSRCFARKIATLQIVLEVFAEAYNKFGLAKMNFRQGRDPNSRELPFSVLDFL